MYARAEQTRKNKTYGDDRTPIPLYLIDFFSRLECGERQLSELSKILSSAEAIDSIIKILHK